MSSRDLREEFSFLDSVRGLAALVVVLWHLMIGFYPTTFSPAGVPPWVRVLYSGEFAVQLFFVLSGFVLSLSFVRGNQYESLQSAAVRRYFRLALPTAVSVFLSYLLLSGGFYCNREVAAATGQTDTWMGYWNGFPPSLSLALNESFYQALFAHDMSRTYNNVLWTMQVEFAGSLFVFAFLALFGKLQNRWVLYGALAFVFTKQGWGCGLSFLSGVALCDLLGGRLPARSLPVTGAVLALAGLFLGGMTPDWVRAVGGERLPGRLLAIHMTAGAVLLLGGIAHAAWLRTVLYARPLIFLGRVSFSLYLVHLLVEFSLGCRTYLACRSAGLDHLSGFLITGVTTTVVSLLLAWVGALTVEPFSIWVGKTIFLRVFKTRRVPEDSKRLPGPSQGQNESSESSSDRGIATALRA